MIIVTGANGFIGERVIDILKNKNKKFFCLAKEGSNTSILSKKNVKFVEGNMYDQKFLDENINGTKTIIHIAGLTHANNLKELEDSNVDSAKKNKVDRIIFLSTAIVTSKVLGAYGKGKKKAEEIIKKSKLGYIILRPSVVYGNGDVKNIGKLISLVKKYPFFPIVGDGNYKIQPIFVDDLAKIIVKSCDVKEKNKIFFAAGPEKISFRVLIKLISKILGKKTFLLKIHHKFAINIATFYGFIVKRPKVSPEQIKRITEDKVYDIENLEKFFKIKLNNLESGLKKTISLKRKV
jgi:NADH dehydrogenase